MLFKIPVKFADKQIDKLISDIYEYYKANPKGNFVFDFTDVEYIDNQELLVLSGIFKLFANGNVNFEIRLLPPGIAIRDMDERVKKQLVQMWAVWQIWKVVDDKSYKRYFGIDGNGIQAIQQEIGYYPKEAEIYSRHGVTPFIILNYLNNYDTREVESVISSIYGLNAATLDLLKQHNCSHPFTSQALSNIITEELYLNFLDHSGLSAFTGLSNFAFMSISFREPLKTEKFTEQQIQDYWTLNFETERLPESKSFFFDENRNAYKNNPILQFSFLDFGRGIADTLKSEFLKHHKTPASGNLDNEILKYAFHYDSSRHPIGQSETTTAVFSRGLFDVLTIAKRYNGMMTVRSNYGKIIYDFSGGDVLHIEAAYIKNKSKTFFPGTLITLTIPAIPDPKKLNISSIKPEIVFTKVKPKDKKFVSINLIANRVIKHKKDLYKSFISELRRAIIDNNNIPTLVVVSFKSCEWVDPRLLVKVLEFLVGDYKVNLGNNVVVINPPDQSLVDEIAQKIKSLNAAAKNYKIHPLPIVRLVEEEQIEIEWLGVYNEKDRSQLNYLLYADYVIPRSDLRDPSNVIGNLNEFDKHGNLLSNFPSQPELLEYLKDNERRASAVRIKALIEHHSCIKGDPEKNLYLCHGNYYQRNYVELNNLTNDKLSCAIVTADLYDRVLLKIDSIEDYLFIGITTTSHKLLRSLEQQGMIGSANMILLDSYYSFEEDLSAETFQEGKKVILFCDVISTGFLTEKLAAKLAELGSELALVAVIVSTIDPEFDHSNTFLNGFKDRIISLMDYPIKKYRAEQIAKELIQKRVTRINPYTNIPITLSVGETGYNDAVVFPTMIYWGDKKKEILFVNKFLDKVPNNAIKLGYLRYNNLIHPYFFDTRIILKNIGLETIDEIFRKINKSGLSTEKIKIFYPRQSGVADFNFAGIKTVLNNHAIENIEIERFSTQEGWRFPSNTEHLNSKIDNHICLILDDGSCSGDSLIQMIDEIAFYTAKEIVLLCIVGRINDHKREFFTRLDQIRVRHKKPIPISIFFAAHWHIPTYYMDENPLSQETRWINDISKIQNTPPAIKNIADTILANLKVQPLEKFNDYKFLPKDRETKIVPKREILLVREEVGKVIGYRLYKESFRFFNLFIKKYTLQQTSENRYKEIELLCATFAYEPYIFDKVRYIMPDVVEKIKGFIRALIFNYEKIESNLTYEWHKIDILHLFFIVFKGQDLLDELTLEKFKTLITFSDKDSKYMSVNYVLYKLLYYFTYSEYDLVKYGSGIKRLLLKVDENLSLPIEMQSRIKIYRWFISTLPSKNSFDDMLIRLKSNYERILDEQFHDDNIYNDKQIISSSLLEIGNKLRKSEPFADQLIVVRTHWEKIAKFVKDILSFSIKFPQFFIDQKIWNELEEQDLSLRTLFGELTTMMYVSDINIIEVSKKLDELFVKYIFEESTALKIFSRPITPHPADQIGDFFKKVKDKYHLAQLHSTDLSTTALDFPQHFLELVLKELYNNLRYSDPSRSLTIRLKVTSGGMLKIAMRNYNNIDKLRKGGNTGEKILNNLKSPLLNSTYKKYSTDEAYLQILKIKVI